ncbi:hypothetical protein BpHYR1_025281 [Brachionus plicatilis]|uniref:Uncharacterized protein n=1 Tax=Brachionus plicatilis TaxID=10195 RepID=A0A3M7R3W9_BRAPC|nr:hypothetical protein BpHYR1_025281 [Brachionus plicatilis]
MIKRTENNLNQINKSVQNLVLKFKEAKKFHKNKCKRSVRMKKSIRTSHTNKETATKISTIPGHMIVELKNTAERLRRNFFSQIRIAFISFFG